MFVHRINTYRYIHTTFKTTCPPVNPLKIPVEDAVHAGQSKKKKKSHAYPTLRCTWDVRNKSVDHFPSTTVAARHVSIPWIPIYATSSRRMKRNDMVETQANDIRHQVITRATFFYHLPSKNSTTHTYIQYTAYVRPIECGIAVTTVGCSTRSGFKWRAFGNIFDRRCFRVVDRNKSAVVSSNITESITISIHMDGLDSEIARKVTAIAPATQGFTTIRDLDHLRHLAQSIQQQRATPIA